MQVEGESKSMREGHMTERDGEYVTSPTKRFVQPALIVFRFTFASWKLEHQC